MSPKLKESRSTTCLELETVCCTSATQVKLLGYFFYKNMILTLWRLLFLGHILEV